MDKVVLKSKVGANAKQCYVGDSTKPLRVEWDKKNDFTAEVPTEVSYIDDQNRKHVVMENWAQHILNSYPDEFEIISIIEKPIVEAPKLVTKKGKKHEESI